MELITSSPLNIPIEMEIMNSHPDYNLLSEGKRVLTAKDIEEEYKEMETLDKERYLIKVDDHYAGIVDFIMKNPRDEKPWLGLFIIHKQYEGTGLARKAYMLYEDLMRERGVEEVRLGCFDGNRMGRKFWEKLQYQFVKEIEYNGKPLWIMEKKL